MKNKRMLSIITVVCILVLTANISCYKHIDAATVSKFQISTETISKNASNSICVSLQDNTKIVAGIELFVAFDTNVFSVESINTLLPDTWELDWVEKTNTTYGNGIHCMVQDAALEGFSDATKDILEIEINAQKANIGSNYDFEVYVIDVSDEQGDSIMSSAEGSKKSLTCIEGITESEDVQVIGYQISPTLNGLRTVSSVEPEINGQKVVEFGNVYGVILNGLGENNVCVGSDNVYVASFAATENGIIETNVSDSTTAKNYVRTMINNGTTKTAFLQEYIVRAYAKLENGTYVYSSASKYSIFNVADSLYQNVKMSNYSRHEYLYNNILKVVDSNYEIVDYNWNNTVVE